MRRAGALVLGMRVFRRRVGEKPVKRLFGMLVLRMVRVLCFCMMLGTSIGLHSAGY